MASSLVAKATVDDPNTINGYYMKELADMTLNSIKECDSVRDALLSRLEKDSPDVKHKVLRVIKYVAQNGRAEFRVGFQRSVEPIKALLAYRCRPDPLRGEAPARDVRNAANEALQAIFSQGSTASSLSQSGRIEGYGSDPSAAAAASHEDTLSSHSSFSASTTSSGPAPLPVSRYGGIGSDGVGIATGHSMVHTQTAAAAAAVASQGYRPQATYSGLEAASAAAAAAAAALAAGPAQRSKGQVGGIWATEAVSTPAPSIASTTSSSTGSFAPASSVSPSSSEVISTSSGAGFSAASTAGSTNSARLLVIPGGAVPAPKAPANRAPGPYEIKLVENITQPSLRPLPTAEERDDFLNKCKSLDHRAIAECIDRFLDVDTVAPATILKALYILEALLDSESDDADDYFNDHPQRLYALENHATRPIRVLTLKNLVHLGIRPKTALSSIMPATTAAAPAYVPDPAPTSTTTPANVAPATTSAPPPASGLFDIFGTGTTSTASTTASTVATTSASETSSFDFLASDDSKATASASQTNAGLFDNLTMAQPPQQQQSNGNLFDGLTVQGNGSSAPSGADLLFATSTPAAPPKTNTLDLINNLYSQQPAQSVLPMQQMPMQQMPMQQMPMQQMPMQQMPMQQGGFYPSQQMHPQMMMQMQMQNQPGMVSGAVFSQTQASNAFFTPAPSTSSGPEDVFAALSQVSLSNSGSVRGGNTVPTHQPPKVDPFANLDDAILRK